MNCDEKFMRIALKEATKAFSLEEVPVGAVVVKDKKIISKAHNLKEKNKNVIDHAEIRAIKSACKKLGSWRLTDCDIYVNLEPCVMCAGAIMQARFRRIVFGLEQKKNRCIW